jgi:hypothetical protein
MSSTSFTDDLKHMVRDAATGARDRLTSIQGGVQPTIGKFRALPAATKKKIAVCGAAIAVLGIGLAMRGEKTPVAPKEDRPVVRANDFRAVQTESPRPTRVSERSYSVAKAEYKQGDYKSAAENYAAAARKGDKRGLKKLVAMTHAPKCEARAEAADALGTLRSKKATVALKTLARARFKDESPTAGIFSCSSRRAAQKALEKQRG